MKLKFTLATLAEIKQMAMIHYDNSLLIVITSKEDADALSQAATIRDSSIHVEVGESVNIVTSFNYGFDITYNESTWEISTMEPDLEYRFHVVDTIDMVDTGAPEIENKVKEIALPDVTAISSDELLKVVANYDTIHAAAIKELNGRLGGVADKLGIEVKAE